MCGLCSSLTFFWTSMSSICNINAFCGFPNAAEESAPNSIVAEYMQEKKKYEDLRKQQPKKGTSREDQVIIIWEDETTMISWKIFAGIVDQEGSLWMLLNCIHVCIYERALQLDPGSFLPGGKSSPRSYEFFPRNHYLKFLTGEARYCILNFLHTNKSSVTELFVFLLQHPVSFLTDISVWKGSL